MREPETSSQSSRLLVVDDDANNRDMLSRRLARRGYDVEVAENGQKALDKINAAQFDLVLLDHMMPGMTGLDLLRLLRGTYSQNELPVIMVTAVDQSQSIVDALDQGANDYVVKPIDMPVVAARIEAQLSRAKADRDGKESDPLTGLGNRALLLKQLRAAIERSAETGTQVAVAFLDLDGFKVLNESFGHPAGDQLLVEVARRLKSALQSIGEGSEPILGRVGGDDFAVVLERVRDFAQVETLVQQLQAAVEQPIGVGKTAGALNVNIGMAMSFGPPKAQAEALLGDAELAMYHGKELGTGRWAICTPELRERAQNRTRLALDLRHAIARNQLMAYYQPKIHLATRTVVGFEALLRWQHPERGIIAPNDFVPLAEETGLILPIGEWILNEACQRLKIWQEQYPNHPPISMNVNVSVKQLADPNLVEAVRAVLKGTGIPPETLKLELTESALITEMESARGVLADLRNLGVGLKLDDFGTGYSSLNYLRALQFDSLKIDRSFISRLHSDAESGAIVETILNLARTLNMGVVAEGIEDEEQLAKLVALGCATGQGFLFAQPLTADRAELLLAAGCPIWNAPALE